MDNSARATVSSHEAVKVVGGSSTSVRSAQKSSRKSFHETMTHDQEHAYPNQRLERTNTLFIRAALWFIHYLTLRPQAVKSVIMPGSLQVSCWHVASASK
jgi:hypothetical protein